jgi:hypothetical protein
MCIVRGFFQDFYHVFLRDVFFDGGWVTDHGLYSFIQSFVKGTVYIYVVFECGKHPIQYIYNMESACHEKNRKTNLHIAPRGPVAGPNGTKTSSHQSGPKCGVNVDTVTVNPAVGLSYAYTVYIYIFI